jgi:hypothetical protein
MIPQQQSAEAAPAAPTRRFTNDELDALRRDRIAAIAGQAEHPIVDWVRRSIRLTAADAERVVVAQQLYVPGEIVVIEVDPGCRGNIPYIIGRKDDGTGLSNAQAVRHIADKIGFMFGIQVKIHYLTQRYDG